MKFTVSGVSIEVPYQPSKYQVEIAKALLQTNSNIVTDAKAGTGKSTTLKLLVDLIKAKDPSKRVLLLAFNKSIVEELVKKMPSSVDVMTSHSLGFKILRENAYANGGKIKMDNYKGMNIIDNLAKDNWLIDIKDYDERKRLKVIRRVGDLCRMSMINTLDGVVELAKKHDMTLFGNEPQQVLEYKSQFHRKMATIDFTDMIYLPSKISHRLKFPKYDYVFVDECQDLSVAQQSLFELCIDEGGRFVCVGDPRQAIYGFAGSDANAFINLTTKPNTIVLPLNECYRCGSSIIEFANTIVPEIEAHKSTGVGQVDESASVDHVQDGDYVLCRFTLPLVRMCYFFIRRGKRAVVKGRDIGASLKTLVKESGADSIEALFVFLDQTLRRYLLKIAKDNPHLSEEECKELGSYVTMAEKHEIIKVIATERPNIETPHDVMVETDRIFKDHTKGGITLSTIHKAKGLEADNVFVIDRESMPSRYAKQPWQIEQEMNLEYVCYTRAKSKLGFIVDWSSQKSNTEVLDSQKAG